MRILLVEDEQDQRVLFHNVLFAAGYHVDSVGSKGEALALLNTLPYDLILTDERLPDGRGIEIADRAREMGMDAVVVTGYGLSVWHENTVRHECLMKPILPGELIEAVDRHVGAGLTKLASPDD